MSKYWFRKRKGLKSKDLGWGFVPLSWEGIVSYIILFGLIIASALFFDLLHATAKKGIYFLISILVLMIFFSLLARFKSQRQS